MEIDQVLLSAILAITVVGSLLVWGMLFSRFRRGDALLMHATREKMVPWNGVDALIILALAIAVQILVAGWFGLGSGDTPLSEMSSQEMARVTAALGFANLLAVACGFAVLVVKTGAGERELGMPVDGRQLLGDLGIGIAGFLFVAPIVYLIQFILTQLWAYEHPIVDMLREQTDVYFWGVAAVSAAFVAPVVEEFFFRLVLQGWLEKLESRVRMTGNPSRPMSKMSSLTDEPTFSIEQPPANHPSEASTVLDENPFHSPETVSQDSRAYEDQLPVELAGDSPNAVPQSSMMPVVISSVLFAVMHLGQGPAPIPLFFLSLVLGYLYRQTHRLLPCVFLHMVFNGFSLVLLKLSV